MVDPRDRTLGMEARIDAALDKFGGWTTLFDVVHALYAPSSAWEGGYAPGHWGTVSRYLKRLGYQLTERPGQDWKCRMVGPRTNA